MNIILSIKPEFAYKIFDGTKKYEFRKSIFKRPNVNKIIVYASSPVQQVIGEFGIDEILCNDVELLWQMTQQFAGISKKFYNEYFANKKIAFAIKVGFVRKYPRPKYLSDFNINYAPQSFAYLE
jgi:predicted transcriptional regulator